MIWEFIKKYYIDSIVYKTGYNPVNTVTWALILIISVYLIYRYLSKLLRFDERFFISNIPFILFGSFLRVFEDAGFLSPPISYMLMSPMIYVVVFGVTFPSLLIFLKLKGEQYWKAHLTFGVILSISTLTYLTLNLKVVHLEVLPISLLMSILLTSLFYPISKMMKFDILSLSVFFSHMLDASATFYGTEYLSYWELHVIPRLLIEEFGSWILIPTKFFVFLIVIWIVEREKNYQMRNFIKFVLLVLGLAPAIRDITRMTLFV